MSKIFKEGLYLNPRWQKKRLEILERDEFSCQHCGDKDSTLHVHHTSYASSLWEDDENNTPWGYPSIILITLCDKCHDNEHLLWKTHNYMYSFDGEGLYYYCGVVGLTLSICMKYKITSICVQSWLDIFEFLYTKGGKSTGDYVMSLRTKYYETRT